MVLPVFGFLVLKNCELEPLYLLADCFNMRLKKSCFSGILKKAGEESKRIAAKRIAIGLNITDTTQDVVLDIWKRLDCSQIYIF